MDPGHIIGSLVDGEGSVPIGTGAASLLVGIDGAGDSLGHLDIQPAAEVGRQNIVVLGHVLKAHHISAVVVEIAVAVVDGDRDLAVLGGGVEGDLAQAHLLVEDIVHIAVRVGVHQGLLDAGPAVLVGLGGGAHLGVVIDVLGITSELQVVVVGHLFSGVAGGVGDDLIGVADDYRTNDSGLQGVGGVGGRLDVQVDALAQLDLAGGGHEGLTAREEALLVLVGDLDTGAICIQVSAHHSAGGVLVAVDVGGGQVGELVGDNHALHLHRTELLPQQGAQVAVVELGLGGDGVLDVAGDDVVIGDHPAIQSVVEHLGGVVAGQGGAGGGVVQTIIEAQGVSTGVGVDLPVGAGVALDPSIIAQGHQDHLGGLSHGHVAFRIEGAVALAGHDAQGGAVLDVVLGPVAGGVSVAVGDELTQHGVLAAVEDAADDGGHLSTADGVRGSIGAVVVAGDDAQGRQHGDSLFVDDVGAVAEIVSAHSRSADDHHGQNHDESQSQAESPLEVSHLEFLLLKFEFGAFFALFRAKWGPLEAYNAPYMVREVGKMKKKGRSHRDRP